MNYEFVKTRLIDTLRTLRNTLQTLRLNKKK